MSRVTSDLSAHLRRGLITTRGLWKLSGQKGAILTGLVEGRTKGSGRTGIRDRRAKEGKKEKPKIGGILFWEGASGKAACGAVSLGEPLWATGAKKGQKRAVQRDDGNDLAGFGWLQVVDRPSCDWPGRPGHHKTCIQGARIAGSTVESQVRTPLSACLIWY